MALWWRSRVRDHLQCRKRVQYHNLELKDNHESSRTSLALDTSNVRLSTLTCIRCRGLERPSVQKHTSHDSEAATRDRQRVSDQVNSRSGKVTSPPNLHN
jgi:hypothetical protein